MSAALTHRSARILAARRLLRRRHRDEVGRFLAEGPQAVTEALAAGGAEELFATPEALDRHRTLVASAQVRGVPVGTVTDAAIGTLTETVTPQGIVAVCRHRHHTDLAPVLGGAPRLVALLAGVADPGNAGTVLRTADAAGAAAVVFAEGCVDPYNGKCVRASAGSLFHLQLVRGVDAKAAVTALRGAGLRVLAADAHGETVLDDLVDAGTLAGPTAWVFGGEAHGLPATVSTAVDLRVRVPIHGRAESLNLAAAAAVCLYASASELRRSAQRRGAPNEPPALL
ncbi:MAG: TrmH family RNA methyltransferase [Micromonosporaceae bacterium]